MITILFYYFAIGLLTASAILAASEVTRRRISARSLAIGFVLTTFLWPLIVGFLLSQIYDALAKELQKK